ncbi:MAG: translocation/assembly module TamB domain-containing protein, partial [Crocinitomicaceae bacterium]|nr:translocation/assembly module TamB domain-containing protein [Crocinitomicaceae bacterium]
MTKVSKIAIRIGGISIEWMLIVTILFAFFIRTSVVQTFLAQKATAYLSKELNTKVKIGQVDITFFNEVVLEDVLLLDKNNDTLLKMEDLYLKLDHLNQLQRKIYFQSATLVNGTVHLTQDKKTGDYNYEFLADYFSSNEKNTSNSKPFQLFLSALNLEKIRFRYDDYRYKYESFGMDYNHLDITQIDLKANHLQIINGVITGNIEHIKANERCGFQLNHFEGIANVSDKGIVVDQVKIKTPKSLVFAPKVHMLYDEYSDILDFVDSVTFDSKLAKSRVSMQDISYFADDLEGMDEMVTVSGIVTKKVANLKIQQLNLKFGKKSIIKGTVNLPDFDNFSRSFLNQKIDYAFIDLTDLSKINLPKFAANKKIVLDEYLQRFNYFQATDLRLDGYESQFVVAADKIKTGLGSIYLDNGIMFTQNKSNDSYLFERSQASEYDVKIEQFDLKQFLNDPDFGTVDGTFFLSGEAFSLNDIHFNQMEGNMNHFDYMGYAYNDIFIEEGSFIDQVFTAKIEVKDDNLALTYDGFIDFNENQHMLFTVDISKALLHNLNISLNEKSSLTSSFTVDIVGNSSNSMSGDITMNGILYKEAGKTISIPKLKIAVKRGETEDLFSIKSQLADLTIQGKIDFQSLITDFTNQFEKVVPSIFPKKAQLREKQRKISKSKFNYRLKTNDLDDFFSIFVPDLRVSPNTELIGHFDAPSSTFSMQLKADKINYQDLKFSTIDLNQSIQENKINALYTVKHFSLSDSVNFEDVSFTTTGQNNLLTSSLTWDTGTQNDSKINWETTVHDNKNVTFQVAPSYFSVNEKRWETEKEATISISEYTVSATKLKLKRNKQFISIDGKFSKNNADQMNFRVNDVDLNELSQLIGADIEMKGLINGWGFLSNPYKNLSYMGDAIVENLYLNKQEVGNVFIQSQWSKEIGNVTFNGDLVRRGEQTLSFDGQYLLNKEKDNLDFNLLFDQTDLSFINGFVDSTIVTNIHGLLDGRLKVSGNLDQPILNGEVELLAGNAKVTSLGVNFGLDGKIKADQYGFYIDNMPINDEEGNTGKVIGTVYHSNFNNWNYDFQFDLETHAPTMPLFSANGSVPLEKFLVLNTTYSNDELYYGKGYGKGTVNLAGNEENVSITVNVETEKGTTINFPMYGNTELSEEENFLSFKSPLSDTVQQKQTIDFTGIDLDLSIKVNPNAKLKIIFNDQTGDEITASGSGDLNITVDNLGDVALNGGFYVKEGLYNFTLGIIKQPFTIEEGGSIIWTGDPYAATIDLKSYYTVNANLSEISPEQLQGTNKGANQKINCYLLLTEDLMKPTIGFDIKAPKASDTDKALLSRITSDQEELNGQFFSLLLWKKFKPLKGSITSGSSGTAMDLLTNQINSILSQVSKDYKLNVNLDADNVTGGNTVA